MFLRFEFECQCFIFFMWSLTVRHSEIFERLLKLLCMYVIVYLSGCRLKENSCDNIRFNNINNINIPRVSVTNFAGISGKFRGYQWQISRVSVTNFGQMFADFSFLSVSNLLPTQIQQISSVYLNVDGSWNL